MGRAGRAGSAAGRLRILLANKHKMYSYKNTIRIGYVLILTIDFNPKEIHALKPQLCPMSD
jgi:hypothetical protein